MHWQMCDLRYDSEGLFGSPVPLQKGHSEPSNSMIPFPLQTAHLSSANTGFSQARIKIHLFKEFQEILFLRKSS